MALSGPIYCPICNKKAKTGSAIDCARHIFGTGDQPHRKWVDSQGLSFIDLMIDQATTPGNKSYQILADAVLKYWETKEAETK
jgi:hypothetical protein